MKNIFSLLVVMSSVACTDETKIPNYTQKVVSDSTLHADLESNPLTKKNKAVAELVVSKAFTYSKTVREVNGFRIVDVVILDKLCHVTVDESSGEMKASKIQCDEDRYFPASDKSN